jgi:hypothetical protein
VIALAVVVIAWLLIAALVWRCGCAYGVSRERERAELVHREQLRRRQLEDNGRRW